MHEVQTTERLGFRLAHRLGVALQAIVLGTGLFLALLRLLETASGARVFAYQGF